MKIRTGFPEKIKSVKSFDYIPVSVILPNSRYVDDISISDADNYFSISASSANPFSWRSSRKLRLRSGWLLKVYGFRFCFGSKRGVIQNEVSDERIIASEISSNIELLSNTGRVFRTKLFENTSIWKIIDCQYKLLEPKLVGIIGTSVLFFYLPFPQYRTRCWPSWLNLITCTLYLFVFDSLKIF